MEQHFQYTVFDVVAVQIEEDVRPVFIYVAPDDPQVFAVVDVDDAERVVAIFKDQTILYAIPDLCQSMFNKNSVRSLSEEDLCELSRQIRYRFSADPHQISRVLGLTYDHVTSLLD